MSAADEQLLDAVEDLSLLSDRQLLGRLTRAVERVELRLHQIEDRLSPPDTLACLPTSPREGDLR